MIVQAAIMPPAIGGMRVVIMLMFFAFLCIFVVHRYNMSFLGHIAS